MKKKPAPKKPRTVEIVRSDYQPSKAELAGADCLRHPPLRS